jgi:carboxyl-terminal processing protease
MAALLWAIVAGSAASALSAPPETVPTLDTLLTHGADLEKRRDWRHAADVYERALRMHGERPELRQRWRFAEQRHNLCRRYHDVSFTRDMLALPLDSAVELYVEVLRKIDSYYVDPIDPDRLIRAGYRQLAIALDESCFQERCVRKEAKPALARLSEALAIRPATRIGDVAAAAAEVREAARIANPYLTHPTAVVLEFLAAACETLDPYSLHLSPQRLKDLYSAIDGNFVGLGVEVRGDKAGLRIAAVLPNSPASEGGLQDGDVVTSIDGKTLVGLAAEEAANLLQGADGSSVRLTVRRDPSPIPLSFVLLRREVIVNSVASCKPLTEAPGVGYLKLASFQKQTAAEVRGALIDLQQKTPVRSLVLDLRGNPGGLLDAAVQVAEQFIGKGVMVRTRGRAWGQSWDHEGQQPTPWRFPLAVLIDGDSASASEILAGAVKDHRRGWLIGTRSYGKGSVQSIFPLQSCRTGLRLTTARFFSPNNRPYEWVGVEPDVVVKRPAVGTFGEEAAPPREPSAVADAQLATAVRILTGSATTNANPSVADPGR